ncbi:MAG: hypothetical protein AAFY17_13420, partial [Cyanobacteria bacterium J06642_11]
FFNHSSNFLIIHVSEKPAEKLGLKIDPYLVHHLTLDLTGAPGELALLQSLLQDLWKRRNSLSQSGPCLSLESYMKLGRLSQFLIDRANALYETLPLDEQKIARRIFLALCDLGEGRLDNGRQARKCELINDQFPQEIIETVLGKLTAARIVVTNKAVTPNAQDGCAIPAAAWETQASETAEVKRWLIAHWPPMPSSDETIEFSHNSLIADWPLMRQWLQERRRLLRQTRDIEERAWIWRDRAQPNSSDYLLSRQYLKTSHEFLEQHLSELSTLAQTFVMASRRVNRLKIWKSRSLAVLLPLAMMTGMTVSLARQPHQIQPRQPLHTLLPSHWGVSGINRLTVVSQILHFERQSKLNELSITQLADLINSEAITTQLQPRLNQVHENSAILPP